MNTPAMTATGLVDLAIHHAAAVYHNPALRDIDPVSATSDNRDDHVIVGEALIRFLSDKYGDDLDLSVAARGVIRATWHHHTRNGHTYRCALVLRPPARGR